MVVVACSILPKPVLDLYPVSGRQTECDEGGNVNVILKALPEVRKFGRSDSRKPDHPKSQDDPPGEIVSTLPDRLRRLVDDNHDEEGPTRRVNGLISLST
jgi:hypothetical protein